MKLKRKLLYFPLYALVLMINIAIVIAFKNQAAVSVYSLPAIFLMLVMIITAALSYFLRHKGNYLPFRRHSAPFSADKDYTFKDEYQNRFFLMLKIYCLAIPFYIPQIFLASSYIQSLWALAVFFAPQIVFVGMGITDTLKDVKEDRVKKEQLEKERLEQERREENGKWH